MTQVEKQYQQAFEEVDKQINQEEIELFKKEARAFKQEQLEKQEKWKSVKEDAEENLRIIKLNLDNLDNGKFDAIKERMEKSKKAREMSNVYSSYQWVQYPAVIRNWDITWLNGTYTVPTAGGNKIFYY
jgi:hypothetical protein